MTAHTAAAAELWIQDPATDFAVAVEDAAVVYVWEGAEAEGGPDSVIASRHSLASMCLIFHRLSVGVEEVHHPANLLETAEAAPSVPEDSDVVVVASRQWEAAGAEEVALASLELAVVGHAVLSALPSQAALLQRHLLVSLSNPTS